MVGLSELTRRDHQICLGRMFQVLAEAMSEAPDEDENLQDEDLWRAYLSAFWLRPETAIILYAEAMAIRSAQAWTGSPWLDLGCGDGIHSAISSGWRFDLAFDAFQSLALDARDIYDHWDASQFRATVTAPGHTLEYGVDIKSTAVARSRAIGVFQSVTQASATNLPLPDKSIKTIFSNMLRDLGQPLPEALRECRRVLRDDGVLLISAMTPAYQRNLCFAPAAREAAARGDDETAKQLLRLDRGRSIFCQQQLSIDQWATLLDQQDLKVTAAVPIVGPAVIRFWDVGLRPFSIPLLRQRHAWKTAGALEVVKTPALDFLHLALKPLLRNLTHGEACMNLVAAVKKG